MQRSDITLLTYEAPVSKTSISNNPTASCVINLLENIQDSPLNSICSLSLSPSSSSSPIYRRSVALRMLWPSRTGNNKLRFHSSMMVVAIIIRTARAHPAMTLTVVWGKSSRAQGHCPGLPILQHHCQQAETYREQWSSLHPQEQPLMYWCTKNEGHKS